ncbi:acetyl-CoA acetyltransferase [Novosphingobium sp. 9U]|uniref:acetyl-CoA acetyltransferase n=1 Tax=Novosphingobium sp. 9U TaxID=2653158 RepID=UPI0012F188E6|nr:acetyl-CoA acetyltransferase [Novosphingobium sp. 9U]VWX49943.1 Thiolase [Novosphingobium sp. 9U]
MDEAVIVGVAEEPLERGMFATPASPLQAQARVAKAALAQAGLTLADVDGLCTANMWGLPGAGMLPTITLSEYLGITPTLHDGSNFGGAAFEAHVAHAALAIERGEADVVLIVYGSAQKSERSRNLAGRPASLTFQYETPWGLPTPAGGYALAAMRHMHEFGTKREDLAEIAVAARGWAALNPRATQRGPLTIDDVLGAPAVSDPLGVLDCCLVTDGAGAVVMTRASHAKSMPVKPIYVRGHGQAATHWTIAAAPDLTRLVPAEIAGKRALEMAGIGLDSIDLVQLYDSFTITVLMTLEALGFCKRGEGAEFVRGGRLAPGGAFPTNTSGGGLSYCHPGMLGIFLLIEAVRQMRGEVEPERQVADVSNVLVHGTGGTLSSGATCILSVN